MTAYLGDSSSEVEDHWKIAISYRRDRREVLLRRMEGHGDGVEEAHGARVIREEPRSEGPSRRLAKT